MIFSGQNSLNFFLVFLTTCKCIFQKTAKKIKSHLKVKEANITEISKVGYLSSILDKCVAERGVDMFSKRYAPLGRISIKPQYHVFTPLTLEIGSAVRGPFIDPIIFN